jgi:hypothetical protein
VMPDPRFTCYAPGSRRLYEYEDGEQRMLTTEISRTCAALEVAAEGRVAKGQITRDQARLAAAIWRAIADDLAVQDLWLAERNSREPAWTIGARLVMLRQQNEVAWADKVAAARHELETRRAGYPDDVAKGRLTADAAKRQLERLEAVHDLYWRLGYAFDGSKDELRAMSRPILDTYLEQAALAGRRRRCAQRSSVR